MQVFLHADPVILDGTHRSDVLYRVTTVCQPLKALTAAKAKERQDLIARAAQLDAGLNKQMAGLEKHRAKYEKLHKETAAALATYEKNEASDKVTKGAVEKSRLAWADKAKKQEEMHSTLSKETELVNVFRTTYYHTDVVGVYDDIQTTDESHSEGVVAAFAAWNTALKGIATSANGAISNIDAKVAAHDKSVWLHSSASPLLYMNVACPLRASRPSEILTSQEIPLG